MDGVLVVDKPQGPTSHDVVARVRRALGETRIGHTGTLDPMATGVLPLVVGRATRLAALMSGASKEYEAGIRFGCATDTYDADGRIAGDPDGAVAADAPPPPPRGLEREAIDAGLAAFRGSFDQQPPRYSAKKIGGIASHRLARRNVDAQPARVRVTVTGLDLIGYADGLARIRVSASAGFYVRSLAHDLGAALGCGAHLASLRRTRAASFGLDQAVPLATVEREGPAAANRIIPLRMLLAELPAVVLTDRGTSRASHGNGLGPDDLEPGTAPVEPDAGQRIRLLDPGGALIGLAETRPGGLLQPVVVLV